MHVEFNSALEFKISSQLHSKVIVTVQPPAEPHGFYTG